MGEEEERVLGDMSSLVALSHELKAPLALIRQLSLTRDYYKDEKAYKQALDRIGFTAERSLRLIEALTRSYRIDELESEPIHLGRLCEEVAHELEPLYKASNQTIRLTIPRQPVLAVGNRELLGSVVYGLCDNAFHYTDSKNPITLNVRRHQDKARVSVIDNGPALTKKELGSIKEKLGKAPLPISMRPGSSGLGLYIAGQFAEAMDGAVGIARSAYSQRFFIELPQSRQLSLISP